MLDDNWGGLIYIIFSIGFFAFGAMFVVLMAKSIQLLTEIRDLLHYIKDSL